MTLKISTRALEVIVRSIREGDDGLETGGALFGPDAGEVIMHASTPGPGAVHSAAYFSRDRAHTEIEASRVYRLDNSQWIGEWHTHPTMNLVPSELDLSTYVRHLQDPELRFHHFLALICSANEPLEIASWRIHIIHEQVRLELVPLTISRD